MIERIVMSPTQDPETTKLASRRTIEHVLHFIISSAVTQLGVAEKVLGVVEKVLGEQ